MEIYKQINIIKTGRTYCLSHKILQLFSGKRVNLFYPKQNKCKRYSSIGKVSDTLNSIHISSTASIYSKADMSMSHNGTIKLKLDGTVRSDEGFCAIRKL